MTAQCPSCGRETELPDQDAEPLIEDCPSPSTVDHPPHLWQEGLGKFAVVRQCPGKRPWDERGTLETVVQQGETPA